MAWALVMSWVQTAAARPYIFFFARDAAVDKFVVALFFDESARTGAAALALIEEEREVRAFDGFFHVGIVENNIGAFAAEFERDALQICFGSGFHNEMADFGGTGERDLIDVHVARDCDAGRWTVTGQKVYNAFGESGF